MCIYNYELVSTNPIDELWAELTSVLVNPVRLAQFSAMLGPTLRIISALPVPTNIAAAKIKYLDIATFVCIILSFIY